MPDDPLTSLPVAPADLIEDDRAALIDIATGRLIDSDSMARRLGGWQIARSEAHASDPPKETPSACPALDESAELPGSVLPLLWAQTAVARCDRIVSLLSAFADGGERRFTAALVAAMVRLIVEGVDRPDGIVDVPLLTPFALRILIDRERLVALGPRERTAIR